MLPSLSLGSGSPPTWATVQNGYTTTASPDPGAPVSTPQDSGASVEGVSPEPPEGCAGSRPGPPWREVLLCSPESRRQAPRADLACSSCVHGAEGAPTALGAETAMRCGGLPSCELAFESSESPSLGLPVTPKLQATCVSDDAS